MVDIESQTTYTRIELGQLADGDIFAFNPGTRYSLYIKATAPDNTIVAIHLSTGEYRTDNLSKYSEVCRFDKVKLVIS